MDILPHFCETESPRGGPTPTPIVRRTTQRPHRLTRSHAGPFHQFVQRSGERPDAWRYKAFVSTGGGDEVQALTLQFPKRWHIEEFFNLNQALDGDVRVTADTIVVTYYNAPNANHLRQHYEGLPDRLAQEHVDPCIPWLYGYKLDFRFR